MSTKRRYSAVAVFSDDLERIVLIHKLKPDWQAGKANLPGGKVESKDLLPPWTNDVLHLCCAVRELAEETGLVVDAAALKHFCTLRFRSREGDDAECRFYATKVKCKGRDLDDHVKTMETETVFCAWSDEVVTGNACGSIHIPVMPNLPWLVAMARQCLRGGDTTKTWPLTVYENGATP